MELPVLLACDTTEGWENGDTALGESELAIEISSDVGIKKGFPLRKLLLIGDGKTTGPGAKRLRLRPENIWGLSETLHDLKEAAKAESGRAEELHDAILALENLKISKSVTGERQTLAQAVKVKEVTSDSVSMACESVSVEDGAASEKVFKLPRVTETTAGIMPAASFNQIAELVQRTDALNLELEEYRSYIDFFVKFIESKFGPLGGSFPLIAEGGFYLVTESDDFLIVA